MHIAETFEELKDVDAPMVPKKEKKEKKPEVVESPKKANLMMPGKAKGLVKPVIGMKAGGFAPPQSNPVVA